MKKARKNLHGSKICYTFALANDKQVERKLKYKSWCGSSAG